MSMSDNAYNRISALIENCDLEPGAELTEADLMQIADTGRTPTREAVQRLKRDSWLETGPNRGIRVPAISVDDQLARLEVRRPLETLAVELATVRADQEQLDQVADLLDELKAVPSQDEYQAALRKCHELIGQLSNNDYLARALIPLQGLSRRFWLISTRELEEELTAARVVYAPALEAIVNRDPDTARMATLRLHDHLAESALEWARIRSQQARTTPPRPLQEPKKRTRHTSAS